MSKHVGEKCGKLHITYILSSQRGITPSKIDAKWRQSNLICSTSKQSHVQNFSSICQSMKEKSPENGRMDGRRPGQRVGRTESRTDGDPDGHHHTIIRPVWRGAYNEDGRIIKIGFWPAAPVKNQHKIHYHREFTCKRDITLADPQRKIGCSLGYKYLSWNCLLQIFFYSSSASFSCK